MVKLASCFKHVYEFGNTAVKKPARFTHPCYDKRCYIYLGTTTVAALFIWLRS